MKQTVFLLTGLLGLTSTAHAQWVQQTIPFGNPVAAVNYIDAVDNLVAWACATDFISVSPVQQVARTTDGGATWTVNAVTGLGPNDRPTSIYALGPFTAWVTVKRAAGPSQVLKTTDGGASWTVQTTPSQLSGPNSFPMFVHFFNANEGVVADQPIGLGTGFTGYEIYTTANGGTTWTRVAGVPTQISREIGLVRAPAVFGTNLWFGTTEGRVYHSPDKGQTWAVSTASTDQINSVAFRDANNGLTVGLDGTGTNHRLTRTTDGGATWSPVSYAGPLHGSRLDNVPGTGNFISVGADNLMGNGDSGSSYSRDNGQTWVNLESTLNHGAVDFASANAGWTSGVDPATGAGLGVYKLASAVLGARAATPARVQVTAYPNPAADRLTVQADASLEGATLHLADAQGRVLRQVPLAGPAQTAEVDVRGLADGLYYLLVPGAPAQKVVVRR